MNLFLSLGDRDEEPASKQVVPVPFGPGHVGTTYLGKHEEGEAILSPPHFLLGKVQMAGFVRELAT